MVILIKFYDTRIIMILHVVLNFMMMNSHENKNYKVLYYLLLLSAK